MKASMRPMLAALVLALAAGAPARAQETADEVAAFKAGVEGEARAVVHGSLQGFFERAGLPMPEEVRVQVRPDVVRVPGDGLALRSMELDVTMLTDHPSTLVREARMQLARDLTAQGYRLGEEGDERLPFVDLKLDAELEMVQREPWADVRSVVVVACLALASVCGMVLAVVLLLRPFLGRRRGRGRESGQAREQVRGASEGVARREPAVDGAALERAGATARMDEQQVPRAGATAQDVDPNLPPSDLSAAAFEKLPFEQALELLGALEPDARRRAMDSLSLHPSIRRRIEAALAETPRP